MISVMPQTAAYLPPNFHWFKDGDIVLPIIL